MSVSVASCRPFVQACRSVHIPRKHRFVPTAALSKEVRELRAVQSTLLGAAALAASLALSASPSMAEPKLPPLDTDPNRCERAFVGNTIGQANAVSDKILDLRFCMLGGKDLSGKTLSGALLVGTDLSNSNMQEVVLTKAYAKQVNMAGADLSNAVVDRVLFDGANLKDVKFVNAVITGSTFKDADLTGATFEDALIASQDAKRLCDNPTLAGDGRLEVGCRN